MNEREQALAVTTAALPYLQKIDELYYSALNLDQQNMAMQAKARVDKASKGGILGVIASVVTWIVLDTICRIFVRSGIIKGGGVIAFILFSIIAVVIVYFTVKRKISSSMSQTMSAVEKNNSLIDGISRQIQSVAADGENKINELPRDYRYYYAAQFFEKALSNYRADSMKEAVNLFEEYLHRQNLENQNQQMLINNQRQNQMLANIEADSASAARGSNMAAAFSVLNFMR